MFKLRLTIAVLFINR